LVVTLSLVEGHLKRGPGPGRGHSREHDRRGPPLPPVVPYPYPSSFTTTTTAKTSPMPTTTTTTLETRPSGESGEEKVEKERERVPSSNDTQGNSSCNFSSCTAPTVGCIYPVVLLRSTREVLDAPGFCSVVPDPHGQTWGPFEYGCKVENRLPCFSSQAELDGCYSTCGPQFCSPRCVECSWEIEESSTTEDALTTSTAVAIKVSIKMYVRLV